MKKILILIVFVVFYYSKAQTLSGIFVTKPIASVGDDTQLNEFSKVPDLYLYKYYDRKSSLEKISKGGVKIDTLKQKLEEYNLNYETIVKNIKPTKTLYFKNLETNTFERLVVANEREIFIKDKLPLVNWIITNEKKYIEGYLCTKAHAQKTIVGYPLNLEAWFCEKIPILDGPFEYYGLPGFILEFSYVGKSTTTFINLDFNSKNKFEITSISCSTKAMTTDEYEKSLKY